MRYLAYVWAFPNTLLGLVGGTIGLLGGGRARIVDGTLEFQGPLLAWLLDRSIPIVGGAAAITLGHVVLARDATKLARCRAHERVHVRQYERWGVLFLPAYGLSSLFALLRGGDPYLDNRFEREAYALERASPGEASTGAPPAGDC